MRNNEANTVLDKTQDKLKNEIINYLTLPDPNGAFLISGEWGSGKTHFVKHNIMDDSNLKKKYDFLLVSLFSVCSLAELEDEIKKEIFKKECPRLVKAGKKAEDIPLEMDFKIDIPLGEIKLKQDRKYSLVDIKNISNDGKRRVIVFDDLERSPFFRGDDSRDIIALFGYINNLSEFDDFHIIIIANDTEINKNPSYIEYKEKFVYDDFKLIPNLHTSYDNILSDFLSKIGIDGKQQFKTILEGHKNDILTFQQRVFDYKTELAAKPENTGSNKIVMPGREYCLRFLIHVFQRSHRLFRFAREDEWAKTTAKITELFNRIFDTSGDVKINPYFPGNYLVNYIIGVNFWNEESLNNSLQIMHEEIDDNAGCLQILRTKLLHLELKPAELNSAYSEVKDRALGGNLSLNDTVILIRRLTEYKGIFDKHNLWEIKNQPTVFKELLSDKFPEKLKKGVEKKVQSLKDKKKVADFNTNDESILQSSNFLGVYNYIKETVNKPAERSFTETAMKRMDDFIDDPASVCHDVLNYDVYVDFSAEGFSKKYLEYFKALPPSEQLSQSVYFDNYLNSVESNFPLQKAITINKSVKSFIEELEKITHDIDVNQDFLTYVRLHEIYESFYYTISHYADYLIITNDPTATCYTDFLAILNPQFRRYFASSLEVLIGKLGKSKVAVFDNLKDYKDEQIASVIQFVKPRMVIFVGIGYNFDKSKIFERDVMISTNIFEVDHSHQILSEYNCNELVNNFAQLTRLDASILAERNTNFHEGKICSIDDSQGPISNSYFNEIIEEFAPYYTAFDTFSARLARICTNNDVNNFIAVESVGNWHFVNESPNTNVKYITAANNAVKVCEYFLQNADLDTSNEKQSPELPVS
jgi:nucleoside phosphorylase